MSKFNFDDLLNDLSLPDDAAPKEPAPGAPESPSSPAPSSSPRVEKPKSKPKPGQPQRRWSDRLDENFDADALAAHEVHPTLLAIHQPEEASASIADLGETLLNAGVIKPDLLTTARRVQKQSPGKPLSDVLIEMGVDETEVQQAVAAQCAMTFERVDFNEDHAVDNRAFRQLGIDYCKEHLVIPLRREGSRLVVGTTRAHDVFLLDEVARRCNARSVKPVLVTGYDIRGVIETFNEEEAEEYDVDELLADVDEDDVEVVKDDTEDGDFAEEAESSPVVRYVNHIIQTALKEGASDIHIEPGEKKLKVRFRIDGVLFEMMNPPWRMHAAITSRLKIMANLDIAERRLPQDGRIRATVMGRKLDLRVSTLPTAHGEKTVMRILDNRSIQVSLDDLGFSQDALTIWKNQIEQPHGIILVTGPTGSGKTTTLYSSLRQLDTAKLNVSTVEDPVEYNLGAITQIQTHDKIGMTFAKALKALLRQDPDVIMVGEIRDMETATIAIQAALTGHLVLSTLHTNDAPASVTRMINIGIEPFLIGAALNSVLAQRLVRRICSGCVHEVPVKPEMIDFLVMHGVTAETLKEGKGCSKCRETGYTGRVGLYELLVLDDYLRDEVAKNPNVTEFRRICTERGMVTLREDGFNKVQQGRTTVEEVLRVTEATI